ncbi:MAG: hypothetical protein AAF626_12225 [Pseudomonadota bacterium]
MLPKIPALALSVRQPWAWAILHGGKKIENRSLGSIRAGRMVPGWIALHAAIGMKEAEYRWGVWRLQKHGVRCPRPAHLIRGAIIGVVEVTEIITQSESPWFGGEAGLVLAQPRAVEPIPAKGALGYFRWQGGGALAEPAAWMRKYAPSDSTADMFPDADLAFRTPPPKPWRGNG